MATADLDSLASARRQRRAGISGAKHAPAPVQNE
jgi:hypothetical protein